MAAERRCKPAALSALAAAVPLGMAGTAVYSVIVQGRGLFEDLALRDYLTSAVVVFALWLVLWARIVAWRRRLGPSEVGPVEQPPRPVSEMTGRELAEWARGDPEKLRRLIRQRRRC